MNINNVVFERSFGTSVAAARLHPARDRVRRTIERGQVVASEQAVQPQGAGEGVPDAGQDRHHQLLRVRRRALRRPAGIRLRQGVEIREGTLVGAHRGLFQPRSRLGARGVARGHPARGVGARRGDGGLSARGRSAFRRGPYESGQAEPPAADEAEKRHHAAAGLSPPTCPWWCARRRRARASTSCARSSRPRRPGSRDAFGRMRRRRQRQRAAATPPPRRPRARRKGCERRGRPGRPRRFRDHLDEEPAREPFAFQSAARRTSQAFGTRRGRARPRPNP